MDSTRETAGRKLLQNCSKGEQQQGPFAILQILGPEKGNQGTGYSGNGILGPVWLVCRPSDPQAALHHCLQPSLYEEPPRVPGKACSGCRPMAAAAARQPCRWQQPAHPLVPLAGEPLSQEEAQQQSGECRGMLQPSAPGAQVPDKGRGPEPRGSELRGRPKRPRARGWLTWLIPGPGCRLAKSRAALVMIKCSARQPNLIHR